MAKVSIFSLSNFIYEIILAVNYVDFAKYFYTLNLFAFFRFLKFNVILYQKIREEWIYILLYKYGMIFLY